MNVTAKKELMSLFVFILNCLFLLLLLFFTGYDAVRGYSSGVFYGFLFIVSSIVLLFMLHNYEHLKKLIKN